MEKLKENYDRVLLIVIGLITLVAGALLITKSFAVGNKFEEVETGDGDKLPETPVEKVATASSHVDTEKKWVTPVAENSEKLYRLFVSIPIVNKAGAPKPIDLYDENTPVRPPVSNKYLMDHNLPYRRDDLLGLDIDGDGFTIEQEFEGGGTDPRDPNDYPDPTLKLLLADISKEDYIVMFASQAGGEDFSVRRMDPPGVRLDKKEKWSTWVKRGEQFPAAGTDLNRFEVVDHNERDIHNAATSNEKKDVGVLTVLDNTGGGNIDLIQRERTNIPIYRASFTYDGPGGGDDIEGKEFEKGDTFKLGNTDVTITITKVTEKEVEFQAKAGDGNPKTQTRTLK